ncbi:MULTISPECIES: RNA polymerase sigma factor [Sphingobacterium]|jgi:RNA polymerase sigma factor (sigma-70 family)|uniref:Sigma-70 family RNA polymerase sigma factor n=1 Tax=Sphingobacterium paramultivorum TaxID=2886510 RepID=A0A7G5DWX3_9SPHI|nr:MULTISPECIES: sigma-70 family RNA polymerase sigma factor [Sphingobacterium]MCS4163912.1 RNA polymerase sigma factor (sigma-70 family) [Sphingobacterium sp. BIGb0116]QMV66248.1 sigma-70 family RNA polymerase sigma factor [Sphingobacterium paramultivorum]WSO15027.1 sigma-70 family RNA polymerase sigma factor [Sphingobacterium paramultivorum]
MNSDQQIWQMFQVGHEPSFKILFERYNQLLFNYGFKFTQDEVIIEDSIQELFVKLWCNRENLSTDVAVKNYLYKAFRRTLVKKIEQSLRRTEVTNSSVDYLPFTIELPHDLTIIRQERAMKIRDRLDQALQQMTARQREIIHLRFFEELPYTDIAEIMGLSTKDTYKLYYRALDSLKKHFSGFSLLVLLYLLNQLRYQ